MSTRVYSFISEGWFFFKGQCLVGGIERKRRYKTCVQWNVKEKKWLCSTFEYGERFVNTYLECIFLYSFQRWERKKERWSLPYLNVIEGAVVKYYLVFERKNRCSLCREKKLQNVSIFLAPFFFTLIKIRKFSGTLVMF